MAITFEEKVGSGSATRGPVPRCTRDYLASTTEDETAEEVSDHVFTQLLSTQPTLAGFPLQEVTSARNGDLDGGEHAWVSTAVYGATRASWSGEQAEDTSRRSFRIGGEQRRVYQSLATVSGTNLGGGTAPNYKGAVNVTDGGVEGVDILMPEYVERVTRVFADDDVDDAYREVLSLLVGTVNDDTFLGFAAGRVLLMSVEGEHRADRKWELVFEFGIRPNETNIPVGDIVVPAKKGWEYLWAAYKEVISEGRKVMVPQAAYVERVYPSADFDLIDAVGSGSWPPGFSVGF